MGTRLRMFRARCMEMHAGMPEQSTVLEVIDGLLALRDLHVPVESISEAGISDRLSKFSATPLMRLSRST